MKIKAIIDGKDVEVYSVIFFYKDKKYASTANAITSITIEKD